MKAEISSQPNSPKKEYWQRPKMPAIDKFQECPMCSEMIASKSNKVFLEHVDVCVDRNTDESDIYKNVNNNDVIGATQMVTRGRRSYSTDILKKPRAKKAKRQKSSSTPMVGFSLELCPKKQREKILECKTETIKSNENECGFRGVTQ